MKTSITTRFRIKGRAEVAVVAAIAVAVGLIASSSFIASATAAKSNICGLEGQNEFAKGSRGAVGEGTSSNAHILKSQGSSEGEYVRGGASDCRQN